MPSRLPRLSALPASFADSFRIALLRGLPSRLTGLKQAARGLTLSAGVITALGLSACNNYVPNLIVPYRPDIQQGNVVIESNLAQLKPGMSQEQVRFILGSPLLIDPFHPDRWDYVFRYQRGTGEVETSRITLKFKDGLYAGYSGDALPDNRR